MLISELCGSLNVQRSRDMPKYVQFVPLKLIEANWAEEFPGATALLAGDPVSVAAGGIFGCDEVFNRIRMVCEVHWNISIYQNIHGFSMTWPANAEFWWILVCLCWFTGGYLQDFARFVGWGHFLQRFTLQWNSEVPSRHSRMCCYIIM